MNGREYWDITTHIGLAQAKNQSLSLKSRVSMTYVWRVGAWNVRKNENGRDGPVLMSVLGSYLVDIKVSKKHTHTHKCVCVCVFQSFFYDLSIRFGFFVAE